MSENPLPPGLTPGDVEKHAHRQAAFQAAGAAPFPGPLREALAPTPRRVFGFELQPVVASHVLFLQQIENPLLAVARVMVEMAGQPAEEVNRAIDERVGKRRPGESQGESEARLAMETVEAFFIFIRPPSEVRSLLREGREAFREAAMAATVDKLPLTALGMIQRAIGEHFSSGFATAIEYAPESSGDGSFRSAPATPMGSAGA